MAGLRNHMMRLVAVLLCLTLLSSYFLCDMYARYTASGSGGDSARAAEFYISESNSLHSCTYAVDINPDVTERLEVKITNSGETAVKYTLQFLTEGNLPIQITPDPDDQAAGIWTSEQPNVWTTIKAADHNAAETYAFCLSLGDRGYMHSGGVGRLTLTLTAEQVD